MLCRVASNRLATARTQPRSPGQRPPAAPARPASINTPKSLISQSTFRLSSTFLHHGCTRFGISAASISTSLIQKRGFADKPTPPQPPPSPASATQGSAQTASTSTPSPAQVPPLLLTLTPSQRAFVELPLESDAVILAGPGTGKTHCIASRVVHLVTQMKLPVEEILVIAASEKTVGELRRNIDINLPISSGTVTVKSIAGLSAMLAQDMLNTEMQFLNAAEASHLLKQQLPKTNLPAVFTYQAEQLVRFEADFFQRLQDCMVTPEHYEAVVETLKKDLEENIAKFQGDKRSEKEIGLLTSAKKEELLQHQALSAAYSLYRKEKAAGGKKTIEDATEYIVQEVTAKPERLISLPTKRFKHIFVDDVQDLTDIHFEFVKQLFLQHRSLESGAKSITVSGDDDQAIFVWRGIKLNVFTEFAQLLPSAKTFCLTENFRNSQAVLDAARNLMVHNKNRIEVKTVGISKSLTALTPPPQPPAGSNKALVTHMDFEDTDDEIEGLVGHIKSLLGAKKNADAPANDSATGDSSDIVLPSIAVLVKSRHEAAQWYRSLTLRGVRVASTTERIRSSPPVVFLVNFLTVVFEPQASNNALYDMCSSGLYMLPPRTLAAITEIQVRTGHPLRSILEDYSRTKMREDQQGVRKVERLLSDIDSIQRMFVRKTMPQLVYEVLQIANLLAILRRPNKPIELEYSRHIAQFLKLLIDVEKKLKIQQPALLWPFFKRSLDTATLQSEDMEEPGHVKIMTLWACRNAEFDYVILPNCCEQNYPGIHKITQLGSLAEQVTKRHVSKEQFIENQRRLVYTAMTRAKRGFIFSFSHRAGMNHMLAKPSRFIVEALNMPDAKPLLENQPTTPAIPGLRQGRLETQEKLAAELVFGGKKGAKVSFPAPTDLKELPLRDLFTYWRCPMQYYLQHSIKIPIKPTAHTLQQQGIYEARELLTAAKLKGTQSALDSLTDKFNTVWKNAGYNTDLIKAEIYEAGMAILEHYSEAELESQFKHAQVPFSVPVTVAAAPKDENASTETKTINLIGTIDRSYANDAFHHLFVYPESKPRGRRSLAQIAAALAFVHAQALDGQAPSRTVIELVNEAFKLETNEFAIDKKTLTAAESNIKDTLRAILVGDFQARSSLQTCKVCPYHQSCPSSATNKATT